MPPTYPRSMSIPPPAAPPTPPPDYFPALPAEDEVAEPGGLRGLQGYLASPLPLIIAAAGVISLAAAFFLPMAAYTFPGDEDPLAYSYFGPGYSGDSALKLDLGVSPAIPLLLLVVAATAGMVRSRRWLTFGRLAALGLGVVAVAGELARANAWRAAIQRMIDLYAGEDFETSAEIAAQDLTVDFELGLWLAVAGLTLLSVSVLFMRVSPRYLPRGPRPPAGMPVPVTAPPAGSPHGGYPYQQQADEADPQLNLTVHDDPPSLSLYKPPKP